MPGACLCNGFQLQVRGAGMLQNKQELQSPAGLHDTLALQKCELGPPDSHQWWEVGSLGFPTSGREHPPYVIKWIDYEK